MRQLSRSALLSTADHRRSKGDPSRALTNQLLIWVSEKPRGYREVMDAWRTTCPRLTIWEDALADGLVSVESGKSMRNARILLTESGRVLLQATAEQVP